MLYKRFLAGAGIERNLRRSIGGKQRKLQRLVAGIELLPILKLGFIAGRRRWLVSLVVSAASQRGNY